VHRFEDRMDGGFEIRVAVEVEKDRLVVDFAGTDPQVPAPLNANLAVTWSAVTYALALLLRPEAPLNEGVRDVLDVRAAEGTLVNALYPAPVAGGNVETSQRIVDVVLGALDSAAPGRIPAASQGTMNNLTVGGPGFSYYETIAGGAGGGPDGPGASAVHTHMTNTRNTPIEALENETPLRVRTLRVARGSGGDGRHRGGDGVVREIELTEPCIVHLLTDRRETGPYGLEGGEAGRPGANTLLTGGEERDVGSRARLETKPGDRLRIRTPGGGGWGRA
jgi:N-methylhydantoinase B